MRPFLFLSLIICISCGVKKSSDSNKKKMTVSELVAEKGAPIREQSIPVPNSKVLSFSDGEQYQVQGEEVTHGFIGPKGDEKLLVHWKHKFKDCRTEIKKVKSNQDSHTPDEYELACKEQGVSVLYQEGSTIISRIIRYDQE